MFKDAYKSPWTAGSGFAKRELTSAPSKNVLKENANKIGINSIGTLPKMVFGSSLGVNKPAFGAMINNSASNVLSSLGNDKSILNSTSISMPKFNTALTNVQTFTNLSSVNFDEKIKPLDGNFNKSFAITGFKPSAIMV